MEEDCLSFIAWFLIMAMLAALTAGYGLLIAIPLTALYILCGNAASGIFGE